MNRNVKIYIDNHADFSNSGTNWLSRSILHGKIWRHFSREIEPFVTKFYGVLPARVNFLTNIYKTPKEKTELLIMGGDDERITEANNKENIEAIRAEYNIEPDDFLIVTGGKIDTAKKQTLLLMEAVKRMNNINIKLIVFGSIADELSEEVNNLADGYKVQYIGWIDAKDSYKHFAAGDLIVFPGRHSVFWEQVVSLGKPLLVKNWEGTNHIDLGGNVEFLFNDSTDEIQEKVLNIFYDKLKFSAMKEAAQDDKKKKFTYSEIAKKSILNHRT